MPGQLEMNAAQQTPSYAIAGGRDLSSFASTHARKPQADSYADCLNNSVPKITGTAGPTNRQWRESNEAFTFGVAPSQKYEMLQEEAARYTTAFNVALQHNQERVQHH